MKNWTAEEKTAYEKQLERWAQEETDEIALFEGACKKYNEQTDGEDKEDGA